MFRVRVRVRVIVRVRLGLRLRLQPVGQRAILISRMLAIRRWNRLARAVQVVLLPNKSARERAALHPDPPAKSHYPLRGRPRGVTALQTLN